MRTQLLALAEAGAANSFVPKEETFLKVAAEACVVSDATAVSELELLLVLWFPFGFRNEDDQDDQDDQDKTCVFDCNQQDHNGQGALHFLAQRGVPTPLFAVRRLAGANVNEPETPALVSV